MMAIEIGFGGVGGWIYLFCAVFELDLFWAGGCDLSPAWAPYAAEST
jgi:hypothetical protein